MLFPNTLRTPQQSSSISLPMCNTRCSFIDKNNDEVPKDLLDSVAGCGHVLMQNEVKIRSARIVSVTSTY